MSAEAVRPAGLARSRIRRGKPAICREDHGAAAERFLLLAQRLRRARAEKLIRTVLVTSAIPDEGRSTVALNLAAVLARNRTRTLLVDADLRAPDLHAALGVPSTPGLEAILSTGLSVESVVRRIEPEGLDFLPAGGRLANPVPLLESAAFSTLLRQVAERFDWVIVDSPPLNPFADTQCIASLADEILLVVRWRFTPREELNAALATLEGLPLLGVVINGFDNHDDVYYRPYTEAPPSPSAVPETRS